METYVACVVCLYHEINGVGPFLMANA
ncbi:hypothetical protein NC651_016082 [Populus alba x Populus x berolinensis]|nr:hypothetical protein NC651_016082 [Populus alba x Populus x berolinensis]